MKRVVSFIKCLMLLSAALLMTSEAGAFNKAIIVAGGGPFAGNSLWTLTMLLSDYAYSTLLHNGFTKDTVRYLSEVPRDVDVNGVQDDIYAIPTNAALQGAIVDWASDAENVFIYLADHGGDGYFKLSASEHLQAANLDAWLDDVQQSIPGTITVVYDACDAGSFLPILTPAAGKSRIVLASSSANEDAFYLDQGWDSMSAYFWGRIFLGDTVFDAFDIARTAMLEHQHALIDDNGDGVYTLADGSLADTKFIAQTGYPTGKLPVIGSVSPDQTLVSTSSATLYAQGVSGTYGIESVWAQVFPPDYCPDVAACPAMHDASKVTLNPVGTNRYEAAWNGFSTPGTYLVAFYARDTQGNTSLPKHTTLSVSGYRSQKAIIVGGGGTVSADLTDAVKDNTRFAYNTLGFLQFDDASIYFMNPDTAISGVDAAPTRSRLQDAIQNWAAKNSSDVIIYLVGEGQNGSFRMNSSETVQASELDTWVDTLQGKITGTVVVIYDGSFSGSFIPALIPPAGKKQVVITSASASEPAHFSLKGTRSFSGCFWSNIITRFSLYESFVTADDFIELDRNQHPCIDGNGNGIPDEKTDGDIARCFRVHGALGKSISIISPESGEDLAVNTQVTIQWTSWRVSGNVNVQIGTPNGCGYDWSYPLNGQNITGNELPWTVQGDAGQNYKIKVGSVADGSVYDEVFFNIIVAPAVLSVDQTEFSFGATQPSGGSPPVNPPCQSFHVRNTGGGELSWNAQSNQSWLKVTPTSGAVTTGSDMANVCVDVTNLTPGTHTGAVSITSNGGSASVGVTFTVLPAGDTTAPTTPVVTDAGTYTTSNMQLTASWTSSDPESGIAEYQYAIGTSAGGNNIVGWTSTGTTPSVTRTGLSLANGTTYYFSVKAKNGSGLWSSAGNSDGIMVDTTPPSNFTVSDSGATTTNTSQLSATWTTSSDAESGIGGYSIYILEGSTSGTQIYQATYASTVTSQTITGLNLSIGKTYYFKMISRNKAGLWSSYCYSDGITVTAATTSSTTSIATTTSVRTTTTTSIAPSLYTSPSGFSFSYTVGGATPAVQSLSIRNAGGGTLSWDVSYDKTWINASPPTGSSTGETDSVSIGLCNLASMSPGTYPGTITIISNGGTHTKTVTLTVNPNQAPLWDAVFQNQTVSEKVTLNYYIPTAIDPEGNTPVSYSYVQQPGDAIFYPLLHLFQWTPSYDAVPAGSTSKNYTIIVRTTDSLGNYRDKSFTVTVNNVNRAPGVLVSIAWNTLTNPLLLNRGETLQLSATGSDLDTGDTLEYYWELGTSATMAGTQTWQQIRGWSTTSGCSYTVPTSGVWIQCRCTVKDKSGATATAYTSINYVYP